ncbi:MAG TPA: response regulator [Candidatus Saccharimonadales bacterium]|nr:response regulator [Candidatus Saccharimonadales bacterium]
MTETPLNPKGQPPQVLCVEDEYFISNLYSRVLTVAGYKVTIEGDGLKGLQLAQTDAYDIILLDLMLPSMSGIDILRTLRDPSKTPYLHAKIIVMTNLEQHPDLRADIEKHADGYLVKADITPRALVNFLGDLRLSDKHM